MQRPTLNLALKIAIIASGKKQGRIARDARLGETALSHIVRGRRDATSAEQERLSRVLGRPVSELFSVVESPAPELRSSGERREAAADRRAS